MNELSLFYKWGLVSCDMLGFAVIVGRRILVGRGWGGRRNEVGW